MDIQNTPRPAHCLIGFVELSAALGRSAGSLRTVARTLPFKRWKVGNAVVFDAKEVQAWKAKRQAAKVRTQNS